MKQFKTEILKQRQISPDYFELTFKWSSSLIPQAGQFLTIKPWEGDDPLLRRPFAFSDYNSLESSASIIYQLRGKGTSFLTKLKSGDFLDVFGPLGTGFPKHESGRPILLAGGIGTGPMLFLASQMGMAGLNPLLVMGYRDKETIPQLNIPSTVETVITTDDGSSGFHGHVIGYLENQGKSDSTLYACGPHGMLKGSHNLALQWDIPCYVSVEEIMACGIGACQGCAMPVNLPQKYLRVCKEGPVFESRIIKWT